MHACIQKKKYIIGVLITPKQSYLRIKIYGLYHFELHSQKVENRELLYHPNLSLRRYFYDFLIFYGDCSEE